MARSTYVSFKDDVSIDLFERMPYEETQRSKKIPMSIKVMMGCSILLLMLVCVLGFMSKPQTVTTQNDTDTRRNVTLRSLGTRFVPLGLHNLVRNHAVRSQVMRNHSHMSQNASVSQQSLSAIFPQKVRTKRAKRALKVRSKRVKRQPFLVGISGLVHILTSTCPPTTTEPTWVENYNETHNIVQNYTFRHIVKATDERENITALDYSKDLHIWHTEKYQRCQTYREMLDECDRYNLTPQDVNMTSPLEAIEAEEALLKTLKPAEGIYNSWTVETCRTVGGLMSLCHSEHIFPESHINMSQIWQPTASFYEESVFHDAELMLRAFNKTEQRFMSGLAGVDLPFLVNGTMLWPENDTDLPWETLNFHQEELDYWKNIPVESFVEAAWDHLNHTELSHSLPSFTLPMREKRSVDSIFEGESRENVTMKPKMKRQLGALASSLLGMAKSGAVRGFVFNLLGPVLKNLVAGGHDHAVKQVARHVIPYTGLNNHDTGRAVHQHLHEGQHDHAIQILRNSTQFFRPHNLWVDEKMPHKDSIIEAEKMDSYQIFRSARKILPYIDHMLTDRLKSQSIVDTSLTTALFGGLKKSLNIDLTNASNKLQKVLVHAVSAVDEHLVDRITIYSICTLILLVSVFGIGLAIRCLYKVNTKVDRLNKLFSDSEEDIPLASTTRAQSGREWCTPNRSIEMTRA